MCLEVGSIETTFNGASFKDLRLRQVGLLSERGTGPYPRDYSGAFAFCPILCPLAWGAGCPDPGLAPPGPQGRGGGGSQRVYPVQEGTRGAMEPPVPLGPYYTPGEVRPNDTALNGGRAPHRPWVSTTFPTGECDEA